MQHKPRRGYKEKRNRLSNISIRNCNVFQKEKKNLHMHHREINRQMIKLENMLAITIRKDEYTNNIYT